MVLLQVLGGPELFAIFLVCATFAFLPVVAAFVTLYLLHKIRGDVKRTADAFDARDGV